MRQTIIIESNLFIHVRDGRIVLEREEGEVELSFAPDDIGILVVEALHARISSYTMQILADAGASVCFCDSRHMPAAMSLPMQGNYALHDVVRAHLEVGSCKHVWREIVKSKILNQAVCLRRYNKTADALALEQLSKKVLLGDKTNVEAIAAARYFRAFDVVRTTQRDEINPMPNPALNYGYALLRACVARAVSGAGLLHCIGIHHDNRRNAFCLVDDLMEPYRPFVDDIVFNIPSETGKSWSRTIMTSHLKQLIAQSLYVHLVLGGERLPLMEAVMRTVQSFAAVVLEKRKKILLPEFLYE